MKLEDQVAPLALARRMKELGFPQDTALMWEEPIARNNPGGIFHSEQPAALSMQLTYAGVLKMMKEINERNAPAPLCAAPTVAEMGEWLPARTKTWHDDLPVVELGERWIDGAATEAEARAKMLVFLAEAGRLDPRSIARAKA